MPGFNGTGPSGRGAMTGGGRGYCMVPLTRSNFAQQPISAYDTPAQNANAGRSFFRRVLSFGGLRRRGGRRFVGNRQDW